MILLCFPQSFGSLGQKYAFILVVIRVFFSFFVLPSVFHLLSTFQGSQDAFTHHAKIILNT